MSLQLCLELAGILTNGLQGTYNVYAEVINADKKPITCLQATVKFGGKKESESIGDL